MIRSLAITALVALCLSACSREQPTAPKEEEQAKTESAPAAAPEATPVPAQQEPATSQAPAAAEPGTDETKQATAAQESVGEAPEDDHQDASLNRLTTVPKNQALPDDRWKAGNPLQPAIIGAAL